MKLLYTTMYSALLMGAIGFNATAQQQLPNSGFEDGWAACKPWTSNNTTKETGENPDKWCISNVAGMKVPILGWQGTTIVGKKAEGYQSANAVTVTNSPNTAVASQTVPGYLTLGTTWSTANLQGKEADGGSFGGVAFTDRPTGIQLMYKRTDNNQNIPSSLVAYLWKGTYTQADVPGNIASKPTIVTMTNRDRNILDMTTTKGGNVSWTPEAECIAKINTQISGEATEWTKFSAKFEYAETDATPEMINVILAAGEYFTEAANVKPNVSLTVDNVRVFYEFEGDLSITMNEQTAKSEAAIQIVPNGDGTCTFTLPNFTLKGETPDDDDLAIGDIVVDNVTINQKDGANYYEGTVNKLELLEGFIKAHVSLSGTVENMKIDVIWLRGNEDDLSDPDHLPIYVEFSKKPDSTTGTTDITVDVDNLNAPVEFYNLQGIRVNGDNLTPGIYVRRQGSAVSKILVK